MNTDLFARLTLEYTLAGMIFFKPSSLTILFINNEAKEYINNDPGLKFEGLPLSHVIPSADSTTVFQQESYLGELVMRRYDGVEIPIMASVRTVTAENEKIGILSFQDISRQKKMMRELTNKHEGLRDILNELTKKNDELQKLDKAKDKFLSLVTHELRTPLNTIVVASEMLFLEMYDNKEELTDLIKNLYQQSQHMMELVNDILDMTKLQSGKTEFYISQGEPVKIIEEQVLVFSDMAEENNITLSTNFLSKDCLCYFDEVRLKQILANLISNAIKFNRPAGKVIVGLEEKEKYVWISITDTGIGIPNEKLGAIFNEFETIEDIANHHKGTGLGLPIVKSLIEGLGGEVSLTSTLGVGTTFFLKIPQDRILDEVKYRSRQSESEGFTLFSED